MLITFEGWDPDDRRPVRGELGSVDRAQTQAADLVTVTLAAAPPAAAAADGAQQPDAAGSGTSAAAGATTSSSSSMSVVIKQNPTLLRKTPRGEVRVGACVWDSGYILCALLEDLIARGQLALVGSRTVELGAGCGLAGLVAARLGASVMLTGERGSWIAACLELAAARAASDCCTCTPALHSRCDLGADPTLTPACRAPAPTDKQEVLVHARGNAAKNKLLWVPPAGAAAAAAAVTVASGRPPAGAAGIMPLDWCSPDAAAQAAAVREAMGGPLDVILASDW